MIFLDVIKYLKDKVIYSSLIIRNPKKYRYFDIDVPLKGTPHLKKIRKIIYRGEYEASEIKVLKDLIRPDDIVLELGAGCGILSAVIAKRLSDSANLYTVEANPDLLESINKVALVNGLKPKVINAAVGITSGEAEFFFDDNFSSSSSYDRGRGAKKSKVRIVSIKDLVEQIRPTVIIFDIEGAERDVLSVPIPESVRVLCGELHPHIIGDQDVSKIIHDIIGQGFDLHLDYSDGRSLAFSRSMASTTTASSEPRSAIGCVSPLGAATMDGLSTPQARIVLCSSPLPSGPAIPLALKGAAPAWP